MATTEQTTPRELPELPIAFDRLPCEPDDDMIDVFTPTQMHAYARQAIAESEARAVACKPAPNWCRTCGRHWSDDESVFCSDPIHKQFSHAPHAAAPAPRPTITINATTPPAPVDVRAFERVLCECVVKHQFSDEHRRGRLTLDVETFLHEWNERKADLDGQQAGVGR